MNNLKKLREEREIKQIEVANYLNVSQAGYSKLEKNIKKANAQTLIKLAKYFNISIDYILGLINEPLPLQQKKEEEIKVSIPNQVVITQSDRNALEITSGIIERILKDKKHF